MADTDPDRSPSAEHEESLPSESAHEMDLDTTEERSSSEAGSAGEEGRPSLADAIWEQAGRSLAGTR